MPLPDHIPESEPLVFTAPTPPGDLDHAVFGPNRSNVRARRRTGSADAAADSDASAWLREYFETRNWNDSPATIIYQAGAEEGITRDRLQRAKKRLGVEVRKANCAGGWAWVWKID